jgi:hypothetical protein
MTGVGEEARAEEGMGVGLGGDSRGLAGLALSLTKILMTMVTSLGVMMVVGTEAKMRMGCSLTCQCSKTMGLNFELTFLS